MNPKGRQAGQPRHFWPFFIKIFKFLKPNRPSRNSFKRPEKSKPTDNFSLYAINDSPNKRFNRKGRRAGQHRPLWPFLKKSLFRWPNRPCNTSLRRPDKSKPTNFFVHIANNDFTKKSFNAKGR